jgi:hypothetical protein
MPSTKRCLYCGKTYVPDPRTVGDQKACTRSPCRRERQRRAYQAWAARNRDYDDTRRDKICRWAKDYPDYWKRYRKDHPGYSERNRRRTRERLRGRRLMFAKQNAIRRDPVGYLEGLKADPLFAKQNAMTRPVEGILTYLTVREMFAKPNAIGSGGSDDVHSAA